VTAIILVDLRCGRAGLRQREQGPTSLKQMGPPRPFGPTIEPIVQMETTSRTGRVCGVSSRPWQNRQGRRVPCRGGEKILPSL